MGALLRSNAAEHSVQGQLLGHFGLRENAFGVTPDPRFLFPSQTHREALASLINGIDCDFGFQILVAQPGMGKTTLLFNFLERFRTNAYTAFLFQPQPNPCELLQSVLHELGTSSEETSLRKLSEQLNQALTRAARERKRVIVVLDEAQNLDFAVLEALRQLSNFETASAKLMQIVLAGQPQLAKRLALPEQEQLMQRISAFGRLSPMSVNETKAYINHRLATAGYKGSELFTQGAVRTIWENSRGVPRIINTLCFSAMLLGFAGRARSIDERIAGRAAKDLNLNSVLAEVYQPPTALSGESDSAAVSADSSNDAAGIAKTGPSGPQNLPGASETVPAIAAPARATGEPVTETLKIVEQKTIEQNSALEKSAPLAKAMATVPLAVTAAPRSTAVGIKAPAVEPPASSEKRLQLRTSTPIKSSATTARADKTEDGKKNVPSKKLDEPSRAEREMALATASASQKKMAEKRSESRIWWAKALALTAITGVLAFVLGQEFLSHRPGQVEANGAGGSPTAQSGSGSGDSVANQAPVEAPGTQPKNTHRNASSEDANDVTVRKFPTDSDSASESSGKTQKLDTIFFDQDSTIIGSQYGPFLRRIADALEENPGASAILEGHTDDTGPESYNQELSSRRAIEVRNALVDELHVSTTRLTAVGTGATAPAQPNSSAAGRAYNRRVEVRLVHLSE